MRLSCTASAGRLLCWRRVGDILWLSWGGEETYGIRDRGLAWQKRGCSAKDEEGRLSRPVPHEVMGTSAGRPRRCASAGELQRCTMENIWPFAPFFLSCSQLSCEAVPGNGVRRGCQTVGFLSFRAWAVLEVGDRWKKKRKKK
jgi:hypothetical protein